MSNRTTQKNVHRHGRGNIDKVDVEANWSEAYQWRCEHCRAHAIFTNVHDAVLLDKLHPCPELTDQITQAVEYREWVLEELGDFRTRARADG